MYGQSRTLCYENGQQMALHPWLLWLGRLWVLFSVGGGGCGHALGGLILDRQHYHQETLRRRKFSRGAIFGDCGAGWLCAKVARARREPFIPVWMSSGLPPWSRKRACDSGIIQILVGVQEKKKKKKMDSLFSGIITTPSHTLWPYKAIWFFSKLLTKIFG